MTLIPRRGDFFTFITLPSPLVLEKLMKIQDFTTGGIPGWCFREFLPLQYKGSVSQTFREIYLLTNYLHGKDKGSDARADDGDMLSLSAPACRAP